MSACCVLGCKNRHSSTSKLKLYRIPSGNRPFQANRRRLWLQAIRQVNGSSEGMKSNARICGAHFVSGEASLEHDSPDFVPSVFPCTKPSSRKTVTRSKECRRRHSRRATRKTAPPENVSSEDLQSSVFLESKSELSDAIEATSHPSLTKEEEPMVKKVEETSSTEKLSLLIKTSANMLKLGNVSPVVILKPVVASTGGFQCELCSQNFISVSQLIIHKQKHEEEKKTYICDICGKHFIDHAKFTEHQHVHTEEPSFSCNMCHRSFTTNHNLKRHKLLHVKDGRKCPVCGVLFCRRHNHILFLPQPDSVLKSQQDCSVIKPQNVNSNLISENSLVEKCIPAPVLKKAFTLPCPPPPVPQYSLTSCTLPQFKEPMSSQPPAFFQPPLPKRAELPASLQVFSPQYLTSALLEVKRNYEYILSKRKKVKKVIVKEEQVELPLISPVEQSVKQIKKERIAYDIEFVL